MLKKSRAALLGSFARQKSPRSARWTIPHAAIALVTPNSTVPHRAEVPVTPDTTIHGRAKGFRKISRQFLPARKSREKFPRVVSSRHDLGEALRNDSATRHEVGEVFQGVLHGDRLSGNFSPGILHGAKSSGNLHTRLRNSHLRCFQPVSLFSAGRGVCGAGSSGNGTVPGPLGLAQRVPFFARAAGFKNEVQTRAPLISIKFLARQRRNL